METRIGDFSMVSPTEILKKVGTTNAQIPVHLPNFEGTDTIYSYTVLNPNQDSIFGFWYAGMIVSQSDQSTLLSIMITPQTNGDLIISQTQVEKRIIEQTTLIKKLEVEGISFGALKMSKMEASFYFRRFKEETFTQSTLLTLHNQHGVKIRDLNPETESVNLAEVDTDHIVEAAQFIQGNNILTQDSNAGDVSQLVDTAETSNRAIFHFESNAIDANGELLETVVNGPSFREVSSEEIDAFDQGSPRPAGLYIETTFQDGISLLNLVIMYSIDQEGNYQPILYKQCSNAVTESFSHKIKKKKKSGLFSSKIKIKHIVKMASEITTECGDIQTIEDLEQQRAVIPVQVISEESELIGVQQTQAEGYIQNFKRALKRVQDFRDNSSLTSKFPKLDLGFYSFALENRIRSPRKINQGPLNLCGPAAYLYLLAMNDPDGYAQVAIELILKGETSYNGLSFEAHPDMFDQEPMTYTQGNTTHVMNQVDWLTMSSLRYAQNSAFWFTYNPADETGAAAMTTHWEMASWVENINNVKEETLSGSLGTTAINDAIHTGKQVLVLIDVHRFLSGVTKEESKAQAQGFDQKMAALFSPLFGNHYVAIESTVEDFGNDHYRLTIWTWGNYSEVIVKKVDFDAAIKKTFIISKEN